MANVWLICPRHTGYVFANAKVASGQRDPSQTDYGMGVTSLHVINMVYLYISDSVVGP